MIFYHVTKCNNISQNPKVFIQTNRFNKYKEKKGIMMNVTLNQNFKTGIDASVLKEVSAEILKRAHAKTNSGNVHSSLRKVDLGVDLYQGKVDTQIARQVAMNNSGLQIQLNQNVLDSIQFLNSQAAQKIQKNVEGKLAFAVYEGTDVQKAAEMPKFNSIISFGTAKDKQGSNPFYHGELLNGKKEDKQEEINIFA